MPLGPIFNRYVYGKSEAVEEHQHTTETSADEVIGALAAEAVLPPPRAFTPNELSALL
jgi:hypothetical protein